MIGIVTAVCLVLAGLLILGSLIRAALDRASARIDMIVAGVLELGLLVYTVLRVVDLAGGHRTSSAAVVVAYLVGLMLIMPIAAALSWAEPTRWGALILASGALVTSVMFVRIDQLWTPHG